MDIFELEEAFEKADKTFHLTTEQVSIVDENKGIEVTTTGHDWDAIAIVQNKTDHIIDIDFYDLEEESLIIYPHEYCCLLADATGRAMLLQFFFTNYTVSCRDK